LRYSLKKEGAREGEVAEAEDIMWGECGGRLDHVQGDKKESKLYSLLSNRGDTMFLKDGTIVPFCILSSGH